MEGTKLFVGGIPAQHATSDQIADLFGENAVTPFEVVILAAKGADQETRCGFVRVPEDAATLTCQAMNGMTFEGFTATLVVRPADNKGSEKGSSKGSGAPGRGQVLLPGGGFMAAPSLSRVPPPPPPAASRALPGGGKVVLPGAGKVLLPGGGFVEPMMGLAIGSGALAPSADLSGGLAPMEDLSSSAMKARAKAEGNWIEAAEWIEQEYQEAGEPFELRIDRLRQALIAAAVEEHFYEAASLFEALNALDPQAAALANADAAAASDAATPEIVQEIVPWQVQSQSKLVAATTPCALPPPAPLVVVPPVAVAPPPPPPPAVRVVPPQLTPPIHVAPAVMETHEGTILSFRADKNFGFIHSGTLGCDAFVSSKQIGTFIVGDHVVFEVTHNSQGKPQAQNLRPLGLDSGPLPHAQRQILPQAKRQKYHGANLAYQVQ